MFTAFSVDIYVSDMRYGRCDGNAIDEVKQSEDIVIGSNDNDGIARYLMDSVLKQYVFLYCIIFQRQTAI